MSHRTRALVVAVAALLAAMIPATAWGQTRLNGTVGPGFTIVLNDASGNRVTNLSPGAYEIVVNDQSADHNFHLTGTGVDVRTEVEFIGQRTFTVTLVAGTYTYVCDPHASTMRGSFTVGVVQPPPPPPPPPPPTARRLVATVGPGPTIALRTTSGRRVTRVRAGLYTIVVRDRARNHNFHLFGRGINKRTAVGARGTFTWRVRFVKGRTYRFVCDPHRTVMKGSFRAV